MIVWQVEPSSRTAFWFDWIELLYEVLTFGWRYQIWHILVHENIWGWLWFAVVLSIRYVTCQADYNLEQMWVEFFKTPMTQNCFYIFSFILFGIQLVKKFMKICFTNRVIWAGEIFLAFRATLSDCWPNLTQLALGILFWVTSLRNNL